MSKYVEFALVFAAVIAFAIGSIAFFGFLSADFTMLPVMAVCAAVFVVCAKTSEILMIKRLGLKKVYIKC